MVDVFLLVVVIILSLVMVITNFYILVYFQHPDDKNTAYFPKFIVVFGLTFAESAVLLLPLDVSNKSGAVGCFTDWGPDCGGLDMTTLWNIVFIGIAALLIIVIPFGVYFYEAEDPTGKRTMSSASKACEAIKYEVMTLIIAFVTLLIMYKYLSKTEIPVTGMSQPVSNLVGEAQFTPANWAQQVDKASKGTAIESDVVAMDVSFVIYLVAMISFVGWFAFVLFGGIGMVALPMDLILGFIYRPKFMPADVYAEHKLQIQGRTAELMELGQLIQRQQQEFKHSKQTRSERRHRKKLDTITLNKFKQMVYVLEKDHEDMQVCHSQFKSHNPLIPYVKLLFGLIGGLLSLLWLLQIILFMMGDPPIDPFLNSYFMWFDKWFPLFGTLSVLVFTMYLLACVAKGCFKFGVRCFCFALHPMAYGGTMMNSFLFNLSLILMATIPVVQFSSQAFADYARLTVIENMFGAQIKYLMFFKFFFENNVFIYTFFAMSLVTLIYLIFYPADKPASPSELRSKLTVNAEQREMREMVEGPPQTSSLVKANPQTSI